MHPDFMRKVDFYLGVPICFFLSIINAIGRLIGLGTPGDRPKRILFIELSEMGSAILAYCAMKKAKELHKAELFFLIFEENVDSVELLDIVPKENVVTIRSKSMGHFILDTFTLPFRLWNRRIDTVVDLELFSRFTAIISFLSGARRRAGFYQYHQEGLYRGGLLTHRVFYNPYYHMSQNFLSLVHSLSEAPGKEPMLKKRIPLEEVVRARKASSQADKDRLLSKLKAINPRITKSTPIVLLNPNASALLPIRKWPIERFMHLAKELLKEKGLVIAITGVATEKPDAEKICGHAKSDRCIDLTGKTTLRELIDLYNVSKVLVTNDSGPAHFASLTDIPIVVLFGPETPSLYSPLGGNCVPVYSHFACSPCVSAYNHRKTACHDNKCLQAITVKEVLATVKKLL
ncbi:MAG: glycosyltransferase family 9 protein [Nanoarchaeota archaeon]